VCGRCYGTGKVSDVDEPVADTVRQQERPVVPPAERAVVRTTTPGWSRKPLPFIPGFVPPLVVWTSQFVVYRPYRPMWLIIDEVSRGLLVRSFRVSRRGWDGSVSARVFMLDKMPEDGDADPPERCRIDVGIAERGHVVKMELENNTNQEISFCATLLGEELEFLGEDSTIG